MRVKDTIISICLMMIIFILFLDLRSDYLNLLNEKETLKEQLNNRSADAEKRVFRFLQKNTVRDEAGNNYIVYFDSAYVVRDNEALEMMAHGIAVDILK